MDPQGNIHCSSFHLPSFPLCSTDWHCWVHVPSSWLQSQAVVPPPHLPWGEVTSPSCPTPRDEGHSHTRPVPNTCSETLYAPTPTWDLSAKVYFKPQQKQRAGFSEVLPKRRQPQPPPWCSGAAEAGQCHSPLGNVLEQVRELLFGGFCLFGEIWWFFGFNLRFQRPSQHWEAEPTIDKTLQVQLHTCNHNTSTSECWQGLGFDMDHGHRLRMFLPSNSNQYFSAHPARYRFSACWIKNISYVESHGYH